MPEAVIVSTARSPIGRAGKGSLKDTRADDLSAQMVRAALAKVPELDPADLTDPLEPATHAPKPRQEVEPGPHGLRGSVRTRGPGRGQSVQGDGQHSRGVEQVVLARHDQLQLVCRAVHEDSRAGSQPGRPQVR